jgi:hypothetical protein
MGVTIGVDSLHEIDASADAAACAELEPPETQAMRLEEAKTSEDLDRFLEEFVTKSIRKTWLRGYESGVVTGKALATGEPLPPTIFQYLMASLEVIEIEEAES